MNEHIVKIADDNSRTKPSVEYALLDEERLSGGLGDKRPLRVLALFEGFVNKVSAAIPEKCFETQSFESLELVGIVATLEGREGLFAQCGWFGNDDLDWFWARITDIRSIQMRKDDRFRGGALSVWIETPFADYVATTSHDSYVDDWETCLRQLGAPGCDIWPVGGLRPDWWPAQWAKDWPYQQPVGSKRGVPDDDRLERMAQIPSVELQAPQGLDDPVRPRGTLTHLDDPPARFDQLKPWVLPADSGSVPSHYDANAPAAPSQRGRSNPPRLREGGKKPRLARAKASAPAPNANV